LLNSNIKKQKIAVVGAGSWGTALACLLVDNGHEVTLWGRNEQHVSSMQTDRSNQRYLPEFTLPTALKITSDLKALCKGHDVFLMVIPSRAFHNVLMEMVSYGVNESSLLFTGTKGFDSNSLALLSDVIIDTVGDKVNVGTITGPSFAKEVMGRLPTALTVASNNIDTSNHISALFRNAYTKVYTNNDFIGVQVGGAVKNVLAIACGISDGLGFGSNSKAALITRGLAEITRLGLAMGADKETFQGLSGMGDLVLTCTDNKSRNRQFGLAIGAGKTLKEASSAIGQEVEGMVTSVEVSKLAKKFKVDMPICQQVYRILHESVSPKLAVTELLNRKNTSE